MPPPTTATSTWDISPSGIEFDASPRRLRHRTGGVTLQTMSTVEPGAHRRARLEQAQLYLVCDSQPAGRELSEVLHAAIDGGVDIVQLRDKQLGDEELAAVAHAAHALCERLGALLIVNDRPQVALRAGADGVHVGQEDLPVEQVREIVGGELLVGLSTHAPREVDAAVRTDQQGNPFVDYIGVGPVHATPTKPGRPPVGRELVSYASAHAHVPFFAIGGIDEQNVDDVLDAGARRICVLRAIAEAEDPRSAAAALRSSLAAFSQPSLDGNGRV
jgi:thiamine-phosphate pyrophosphorylase